MPIPPTRARHRDILDNNEDVTTWTERELLLRAVNGNLGLAHEIGLILAKFASIDLAIAEIRGTMAEILRRLAPNGEIEQRARVTSSHAIESAAETVAEKVLAEFHGPRGGRNTLTREGVIEIMNATIGADKLARLEQAEKDRKKLRMQIIAGVVTGIALMFAAAVVGHFEGRASAPQAVQVHP